MSEHFSRREFLRRTAATGVGLGLGGCLWGVPRARGQEAASERLGIGMIGVGGMGRGHLGGLLGNRQVEVLAVCDVDQQHLDQAVAQSQGKATPYRDYQELLARDDIDAVCISTPDHWHALPTLHACQAGKDVYVEKPLSHNIAEGRAMIEAARRYDRVVQVGTMQRSWEHFRHVVELVRSGRIGEVREARCWFGTNPQGKWEPDREPPPHLDWDRWLGPAPWVPYNPNRVHFVWRSFWDYGGGLMTDWGVHLIDIVHWAMNEDVPRTVEATGTYPGKGYTETPEELEVVYEYPSYKLTWTQKHGQKWDPEGHGYGILFYGSEANLFTDRGGYRIYPEDGRDRPLGPGDVRLPRVRSHWQEFLDCMRTRERPTCDVAVGHASTAAPMLGNLAFRIGRKLTWDGQRERFVDDPDADRLLSRVPRAPYSV